MTFKQALIKARVFIEKEKTAWICIALWDSSGHAFTERIEQQLDGHLFYHAWVKANHPAIYAVMCRTPNAFRQGRLQWIDHMIAQEDK